LVIGSIGSGNRTCLKTTLQLIKNIALRRYRQYQKIISANSALSFQRKETVLAMLWKDFTTDEIKKSNVKT
jgi:hypothetical protein